MVNKILNISLVPTMLKNRPLCVFHPKMNLYKRDFDKTKCMYLFSIKDERLLEKYNEIWEKVIQSKENLIANLYIIGNI